MDLNTPNVRPAAFIGIAARHPDALWRLRSGKLCKPIWERYRAAVVLNVPVFDVTGIFAVFMEHKSVFQVLPLDNQLRIDLTLISEEAQELDKDNIQTELDIIGFADAELQRKYEDTLGLNYLVNVAVGQSCQVAAPYITDGFFCLSVGDKLTVKTPTQVLLENNGETQLLDLSIADLAGIHVQI